MSIGTATDCHQGGLSTGRRIKLLSYNIQAGIDTRHYRDYVTKGWKHLLPHRERIRNLNLIAAMLHDYDVIGLQEVDSGSLRSGFVDMTEFLASRAGYPYWYKQVNRNMGMLAQHSNGVLSRIKPTVVSNHRLPPGNGRGAMVLEFGSGKDALVVVSLHLALSRRVRVKQLDYIHEQVGDREHLVVMGDLNAGSDSRELKRFMEHTGMRQASCNKATFPSWRPVKRLDHVLVSPSLTVLSARVVDYALSDHLPISVELMLPEVMDFAA